MKANINKILNDLNIKVTLNNPTETKDHKVMLFAYTRKQAATWKVKLLEAGYEAVSYYDNGANIVEFKLK